MILINIYSTRILNSQKKNPNKLTASQVLYKLALLPAYLLENRSPDNYLSLYKDNGKWSLSGWQYICLSPFSAA